MTDEQITKRKVTMTNWVVVTGEDGTPNPQKHEAVDYVRDDFLDAYVADAKTRWQNVAVGDYDAGPGGYHGPTYVPPALQHPLAGQLFPATDPPKKGKG
jgi:hypothetical protein